MNVAITSGIKAKRMAVSTQSSAVVLRLPERCAVSGNGRGAGVTEWTIYRIAESNQPGTEEQLVADLRATDRPPVVYVQDVQVAGPVTGHPYGFDGVRGQCESLSHIAKVTGGIIVAGHCMPGEAEDSWRVATDAADEAFVIEYEDEMDDGDRRDVTLLHLVAGHKTDSIPWVIDHGPTRWRQDYLEAARRQG